MSVPVPITDLNAFFKPDNPVGDGVALLAAARLVNEDARSDRHKAIITLYDAYDVNVKAQAAVTNAESEVADAVSRLGVPANSSAQATGLYLAVFTAQATAWASADDVTNNVRTLDQVRALGAVTSVDSRLTATDVNGKTLIQRVTGVGASVTSLKSADALKGTAYNVDISATGNIRTTYNAEITAAGATSATKSISAQVRDAALLEKTTAYLVSTDTFVSALKAKKGEADTLAFNSNILAVDMLAAWNSIVAANPITSG